MKGKDILKLPVMADADAGPDIRSYLAELFKVLISEGDSFSAKRPLGNSDWEAQLAVALIRGGAITGSIDSDGEPNFEWSQYSKAMNKAVKVMLK